MSPPDPDQNALRSVLSWESVVDDDAADSEPNEAPEPPAPSPAPAAAPTMTPHSESPPVVSGDDLSEPLSLSLPALRLDPLPPIPEASDSQGTPAPEAPVLGGIHLDLPPIDALDATAVPPVAEPEPIIVEPTAEPAPIGGLDLTISPLDVPAMAPSGRTPVVGNDAAPVADDLAAEAVADAVAALDAATPQEPATQAALPNDPVPSDPTPTTVIPGIFDDSIAAPTGRGADQGSGGPITLPQHNPSQAGAPHAAQANPVAYELPAAEPRRAGRKQQKQQAKKQKHQQRKQKSGRAGGVAVFFTLFVLVGLIVGAILFGQPYLFPDKWDVDAKPYGEAVEAARGTEITEPLLVTRQATSTYGVMMADQLLGEWESDLPMWRSLGLATGPIDEVLLRDLVDGWTNAYYSSADGVIFADAVLPPADVDGAIIEAMAAAAIDQETGYSARLDPNDLDSAALTQAIVIDDSRETSAATSFGQAVTDRRIDVAAFLPPVLEYRVNAPLAYAALVPDDAAELDAIVGRSVLAPSEEFELAESDVVVAGPDATSRSFWYLVFASYTDAVTAYDASNVLVQSSLTTADRAGRSCTYGSFAGTDADGTAQLTSALGQWVANAPVELNASFTTLADGTMQLTACDPGVGFEGGARFGVARELSRWRLVELAALEHVDPLTGTPEERAAEVARVQESHAATTLMALPFDSSAEESARLARLAAVPSVAPTGGAEIESGTPLDE